MKTWEPNVSTQFSNLKITRNKPQIAVEAWTAVYRNHGNHVAISAPTLDKLAEAYLELTDRTLERERAQHVVIAPYLDSDSEAL